MNLKELQEAQEALEARWKDDEMRFCPVPPEPGTCDDCFNIRYWEPRRGCMSIYCGYCSDRRLPQPDPFKFSKKKPCKAFRPYPEKWDPEEQTVRTKEMPHGVNGYGLQGYIPTGDEPLPPEGMTEP